MMFTLLLSLKIGRSGLYTFVLSFQQLAVIIRSIWKLSMTGFEQQTSRKRSNGYANWAKTTAPIFFVVYYTI